MRRSLAIAAAACAILTACRDERRTENAPVIIIIADALRHDFESLPGYKAAPDGITSLSRQATTFERAYVTEPFTEASFSAFFTGHMVPHTALVDASVTWPVRLRKLGYETTFIASSAIFGTGGRLDLSPIVTRAVVMDGASESRPMSESVALATRTLRERRNDRFVLVVHLFYPHAPYWRSSYGESAAILDQAVAEILRTARQLDVYDRAHIIVTSDHGESLQEHSSPPGHGWSAYDEETRVPLIWKWPGQREAKRHDALTTNYDIGPTLLAAISGDDSFDEEDERAGRPIRFGAAGADRVVFHTALPTRSRPVPQIAIRNEQYVLLQNAAGLPQREVYDHRRDPALLYDLATTSEGRRTINRLAPELDRMRKAWHRKTPDSAAQAMSPEAIAKLKALGYLGTGPSLAPYDEEVVQKLEGGLELRYRSAISMSWPMYSAETYDDLYPRRLLVTPSGRRFVVANSSRDLIRLPDDESARSRGAAYHEPWLTRSEYSMTVEGEGLTAVRGATLQRFYADEQRQTFAEPPLPLARSYDDVLHSAAFGYVLFSKEGMFVRGADGGETLIAPLSSDAARTAVDAPTGTTYTAAGKNVYRIRRGQPAEMIATMKQDVLSMALRGRHLWVGVSMEPLLPAAEDRPIVILEAEHGTTVGGAGRRLTRDPAGNLWGAIDTGPRGICMPKQLVFHDGVLYVLDAALERIMSYDVVESARPPALP